MEDRDKYYRIVEHALLDLIEFARMRRLPYSKLELEKALENINRFERLARRDDVFELPAVPEERQH